MVVSPEPTRTTSVSEESSPPESFTQVQGWLVSAELTQTLAVHWKSWLLVEYRVVCPYSNHEESSPTDTFTQVQGGSSLPKPLDPLADGSYLPNQIEPQVQGGSSLPNPL